MKKFMNELTKQDEITTEFWFETARGEYGRNVVDDQVQVWRALKGLTTGEAPERRLGC